MLPYKKTLLASVLISLFSLTACGGGGGGSPGPSPTSIDSDGDGVIDSEDQFPDDPNESADSDGDGVGDNADVFPNDASEVADSDEDGVGDNADIFPNDASETMDSDEDGVGDNADIFPNDGSETVDNDEDGIGDNADTDDDNDGISDSAESTVGLNPLDASDATGDLDNDGIDNLTEFTNGTNLSVANITVEGVIVSGNVTSGSVNGSAVDGTVVTVVSYDANDAVIATDSGLSNTEGVYQVRVADQTLVEQPNLASRYQVTFSKDGFAEKVFEADSTAQSGQQLDLNATLQAIQKKVFRLGGNTAISASADGGRTLSFGLFKRKSTGGVSLLAGDAYVKAAADGDNVKLLGTEIPASMIDDTVESVTVESGYFNPNDSQQRTAFPGDFIGVGETENQGSGITLNPDEAQSAAEGDEYRLISSVFAQLKISDQDGNNLTLDDSAAAAAEGDPVITLAVPEDSYSTIVRDQEAAVDGVQVPIYVYNDGWQFVGNATLVVDMFEGGQEYLSSGYALYTGTLAPTAETIPGGNLYAYVEIVDGNDWLQWINLDWPIIAANEEVINQVCFTGQFEYESNQDAEPFIGYLDIQLPDGGYEWNYLEDGSLDHSTLTSTPGTGSEWSFNLWNEKTNQYQSVSLPSDTILVDDAGCNDFGTVQLRNPYRCEVNGTVRNSADETVPWVYIESASSSESDDFVNYAFSDAAGTYQLNVPCDEAVQLVVAGDDSTQVERTVSSTQGVVTVDFTLENQAPSVQVWGDVDAEINESFELNYWTFDGDGNQVTVEASCEPSCSAELIDGDTLSVSSSVSGDITVELVATDDAEQSKSSRASWEVTILDEENNRPSITAVSVNDFFYDADETIEFDSTFVEGLTVDIIAFATDPDGDDLTYSWSDVCDSTSDICTLSDLAAGDEVTVTVEITDGLSIALTKDITVRVAADNAPEILYTYVEPSLVSSDVNGNSVPVALIADAVDDITPYESLIFEWEVLQTFNTDGVISEPVDVTVNGTVSGGEVLFDVGSLSVGRYEATFTVTDSLGQSSSDVVSFFVSSSDSAEIIIE